MIDDDEMSSFENEENADLNEFGENGSFDSDDQLGDDDDDPSDDYDVEDNESLGSQFAGSYGDSGLLPQH